MCGATGEKIMVNVLDARWRVHKANKVHFRRWNSNNSYLFNNFADKNFKNQEVSSFQKTKMKKIIFRDCTFDSNGNIHIHLIYNIIIRSNFTFVYTQYLLLFK